MDDNSYRAGSAVARAVLENNEFELVSAIARRAAGLDVGEVLGLTEIGIVIDDDLDKALSAPVDVFIELQVLPPSERMFCMLSAGVGGLVRGWTGYCFRKRGIFRGCR